ncbi:GGDEF domain-containing protein [bacterium]|nr:GGDEF domain-containing protein [bacterium]MBU1884911.1 GGDEF domain-containing protein [bacterium]
MRKIGIEIKIILSVVFFTLLIAGLERYQLSENIVNQFINSKKSKNKLLMDTILPVISLDLSLGLGDSNIEFLDLIVKQNKDIKYLHITNKENKPIFQYPKNLDFKLQTGNIDSINNCASPIVDNITGETIGHIYLEFYNNDYEQVLSKNKETTIKIFLVTLVLLGVLVYFIKKEFKHLRKLTKAVLQYDPKQNHFSLKRTKRLDEVGVIHNAIIDMVDKISSHTKLLDDLNYSLEEKIIERTQELQKVNEQLEKLSITDPLTKVSNRRHFENYVQEIWNLSVRTNIHLSLIMCDIDYFKTVNDTYGHLVGDEVLKNVAKTIQKSLKRSTDLVARYGGEEFVIILCDTDIAAAKEVCEEIVNNLKHRNNFKIGDKIIEPFTMSFGISSMRPTKDHRYKDLLRLADEALYKAKENGRNQTVAIDFNDQDS